MSKNEYLKLIFDKALSRYGKVKTYCLLGLGLIFTFNQPAGKYIEESWDGIPPPWAILISTVIFVYFFIGISFELTKNSLIPKLQLTSGSGTPFEHDFEYGPGIFFIGDSSPMKSCPGRLFRIQLKNSGGQMVRDVQLRLKSIEPKPSNLHVPLNLKKMHDNPDDHKSFQSSFNLSPGAEEYFDILQMDLKQNLDEGEIEITHITQGVDNFIPKKNYTLTIEATGDRTQPIEKIFKLIMDDPNNPIFE